MPAISERGGVLGAMDTMVQRGKIQEESMVYNEFDQGRKKHDGSLPLIGVNTFLPKDHGGEIATEIELIRSTEEEKGAQITNVKRCGEARNALASDSLKVLQGTARDRRNVFEQLIEAVKYNSLGQISHALYEVGGSIGGICKPRLNPLSCGRQSPFGREGSEGGCPRDSGTGSLAALSSAVLSTEVEITP